MCFSLPVREPEPTGTPLMCERRFNMVEEEKKTRGGEESGGGKSSLAVSRRRGFGFPVPSSSSKAILLLGASFAN